MAENLGTGEVILYSCISAALTLFAGLMSGLTLGLLSMDIVDLEVLVRSGTPSQKLHAKRVMRVLNKPHQLLVTLLLCNAAAMEALPIFLDKLTNPVVAVAISVTAVLIFGEILPQAVCKSYGVSVGARTAWLVQLLMGLTVVIAWPISKGLDWMLGDDNSSLFKRGELRALVDIHGSSDLGGYLSREEINIITGALDLTAKTAASAMTPIGKVMMLSADTVLDKKTVGTILVSGHSRIPVHAPGNKRDVLGLILVKELASMDLSGSASVGSMRMRRLPCLRVDTPMYDMLKLFQVGRSHMAILTEVPSTTDVSEPLLRDKSGKLPDGAPETAPATNASDTDRTITHTNPMLQQLQRPDPDVESGLIKATVASAPLLKPAATSSDPSFLNQPCARPATPYDLPSYEAEPKPVGIITIEDVIEELIQDEIVDETDQFVDNERSQAVNAALLLRTLPPALRLAIQGRRNSRLHTHLIAGAHSAGGTAPAAAAAPSGMAAGVSATQLHQGPAARKGP